MITKTTRRSCQEENEIRRASPAEHLVERTFTVSAASIQSVPASFVAHASSRHTVKKSDDLAD